MAYSIWVSAACNLKCKYCYEGLDKPNLLMREEIADKSIEYIFNDFSQSDDKELLLNFHGGEPLLNFKLMKYIVFKIEKKLSSEIPRLYSVTTNVTILNNEILHFLKKNNFEITLSIDGCADTQNKMRPFVDGKGSSEIVIKNAIKILEKMKNIRVRMTFDPDSVDRLADNVIYLIKNGFKTIVPVQNSLDNRWKERHVEMLEQEIDKIKNYLDREVDSITVSLCDSLSLCNGECNGGKSSKHIYFDGSIYPCLMAGGIKEFSIGNIYTGINSESLSQVLSYSKIDNPVCADCDLISYCNNNRCKIINKLITGDYLLPPVIDCNINNVLFKKNGVVTY